MKNRVFIITGASRGIGKAIALKLAQQGGIIVLTGKSLEQHASLEGSLHQTAQEIKQIGGQALCIQLDVRKEEQIKEMIGKIDQTYGQIDGVIHNAGAISLTRTEKTSLKKFDLMHEVNYRGFFALVHHSLSHLKKSSFAHILTLSPPLNIKPKWFAPHCAYTISKYAMSLSVLGMAEEFKPYKICVNALWPKTLIQTAALKMLPPSISAEKSRKACIVADAAYHILSESFPHSGYFHIDEDVLRKKGIQDFSSYRAHPNHLPYPDLFVE